MVINLFSGVYSAVRVSLAVLLTALIVYPAPAMAQSPEELTIAAGKSAVVTSDPMIERVSVGFGDVAEAMAVGPREVLVNAKTPGATSLIVWQAGGGKMFFDVKVKPNPYVANDRLDGVRRQLRTELPDQEITPAVENDTVFLRGRAKDLTSVNRAVAIASTLGKVINLLYVDVPAPESQILLKVRFASIDRNNLAQLGANLFSLGGGKTIGTSSTEQFPSAQLPQNSPANQPTAPFVFSDLLNLFLFRTDIDAGAVIKALQVRNLLEVLAEPNVLTENGKQGTFLAGGEFPYPVVQGGNLFQTVTIQFREFGVRLNFIPTITPAGTIHLQVAPEVSALDPTNGVTLNGFSVPGLISRKVNTEVELQQGQSFAIAGLLDRRVTESFQKVPFVGDIPILGTFFRSKNTSKTNTELIVIVTPEIVQPVAPGSAIPLPAFPKPFLDSAKSDSVPGTGAAPARVAAAAKSIPVEQLIESMKPGKALDQNSGAMKPGDAAAPAGVSGSGGSGPASGR
jgi:pilus assembly protein CpaC